MGPPAAQSWSILLERATGTLLTRSRRSCRFVAQNSRCAIGSRFKDQSCSKLRSVQTYIQPNNLQLKTKLKKKKINMSKKIGNGNYYNEIGIKIAGCRLSVRFPTGAPAAQKSNIQTQEEEFDYGAICKKVDHYRSDWTWVPVRSPTTKVLSKPNRPLPPPPQAAPPVPPRAASPSVPPTSALPPYPSSTVSRKSSKSSRFSKSSRCSSTSSSILPESRISSYV